MLTIISTHTARSQEKGTHTAEWQMNIKNISNHQFYKCVYI